MPQPLTPDALRAALPPEGLFAEKEWRSSPEPFPLSAAVVEELEKLGHRLAKFQRACNLLYRLSLRGKQPGWIARCLDAGKPEALLAVSRAKALAETVPHVIRPDLLLTDTGFAVTELDSVPGGIGLTGWLNETYATGGYDIVGGRDGMLDGFRKLLPEGGTLLVSDEAGTYRPEMHWIARHLNDRHAPARWEVADPAHWTPPDAGPRAAYRFFELFDLPNLPATGPLLDQVAAGTFHLTPPPKPQLEEKLWAALFWMRPLRDFWRRELGDRHWHALREIIPQTWLVDPTPLPHHAVIPGLDIQAWSELATFTQKERQLVLKVSGFSERAWGSRGVLVGSDLPHAEWEAGIRTALDDFERQPWILQRFHHTRLIDHPYFDPADGSPQRMRGRVRLCPYYFLDGDAPPHLGGVLATICPADKKLIHGMRDAVIVPCAVREEEPRAERGAVQKG